MFTGIIKGLGTVLAITDRDKFREIVIDVGEMTPNASIGASVAVSGCCLTITRIKGSRLTFEVMEESLRKTTTGELVVGSKVNIEPSMHLGDEIGGHFVLGHVDGVGEVTAKFVDGENTHMRFKVPEQLARYVVDKGSIAIDGISLTICDPAPSPTSPKASSDRPVALAEAGSSPITGGETTEFDVWLLPLTLERTTFGFKDVGDKVNLEADYLLKAVLKNR